MATKKKTAPAANATTPSGKLSEFLSSKKIDTRRLLAVSGKLERLKPADKAVKLAQRKRKAGDAKATENAPKTKPASGRPVTQRALNAAFSGKTLSGPQKTRILRAVNKILELKKQDPVALDALF
jgi:hypothetical protein